MRLNKISWDYANVSLPAFEFCGDICLELEDRLGGLDFDCQNGAEEILLDELNEVLLDYESHVAQQIFDNCKFYIELFQE